MKFGLLKISYSQVNIGDYVQMEGLRQLYARMNIPKDDIIEIERNLIGEYDGDEYVILPICGYFSFTPWLHLFPFPEKIIPIYIGFQCFDEDLIRKIAKEHKKFEPFGCRDLLTMKLFKRYGADAYMSGCMSIAYPKREEPKEHKVFLYDPLEELIPYIPKELMDRAETLPSPHIEEFDKGYSKKNEVKAKELMDIRFKKLREEADLVITSRLHVALPCLAMGIPVVLSHICQDDCVYDSRFSGLDKILKVYQPSEYNDIDWNPKVPDLEWLKELTMKHLKQRMKVVLDKWETRCKISEFFESTEPKIYYEGMKAQYLSEEQKFEYTNWYISGGNNWSIFEAIINRPIEKTHIVLYGAGDRGKWALRRYYNLFQKCKDFSLVDGDASKWGRKSNDVMGIEKPDITFREDVIIENPDIINSIKKENLVVIVAANRYYEGAGSSIGNMLIRKYGLREEKEFFFLDKLDCSMQFALSESSRPISFQDGF